MQRHSEGMWSFLKPLKYLYSWVKLTYRQRLGSHSHSKVLKLKGYHQEALVVLGRLPSSPLSNPPLPLQMEQDIP